MPDYLKRMISAIPNAYEHGNVTRLSVRDALEEIRSGKHKQYVEHVRKTEDKESRRRIKPGGKSYAFSGTFDHVRAEGLLEHSSLICLDYDDVEDAAAVKEDLREDPHVVAFFDSVSGTGLKVLVPVDPAPKDNEEQALAFEALSSRWARWGLRPDRAAKDVSRLCFTSWDPELYASEEAEPVKVNYSHERERRKSTEGRITTKETGSGIVVPDGHKYPNAQVIIGALTKIGLPEEWIRTMAHAWLNEHAETPWEAAPLDKLIADIAAKDNSLPWSTYIANLAKSQARDIDISRAGGVTNDTIVTNGAIEQHRPHRESQGVSRGMDVGAFLQIDFPPIQWLVPNLLPEGLTMLAGKPKTGKSFFALNIAVSVATGGMALGKIKVEKGHAVYVNLDSSPREFQTRFQGFDMSDADLRLYFDWPPLISGGLDMLAEYVEARPDTRIVVIDTLKHVRAEQDARKSIYEQDYNTLHPLAQLARSNHGLGIMVVHHANKLQDADDPFDQISGSTGLTAAIDTGAVLRHNAGGEALYVKGKEIGIRDVGLQFDRRLRTWTLLGDAAEAALSATKRQLLEAVKHGYDTPQDIADYSGVDYANVRQTLVRMAANGEIKRVSRGKYAIKRDPIWGTADETPF